MIEAEALRSRVAINGKRCACQCCGAKWAFVQALCGIGKPRAVSLGHLDIGKAMMAERHGLRRLHMSETRHDCAGMALGLQPIARAGTPQEPVAPLRKLRAPTGANQLPPDHCANGRCAGVLRPARSVPRAAPRRSYEYLRIPCGTGIRRLPFRGEWPPILLQLNLHAALSIIPVADSIAACASEPAMSSRASRLSKSMEVLISSMIADGPRVNRPPHILFAVMIQILPPDLETGVPE